MEVILKEDVLNLGYKNDIVNVKDGYGRNYLIPQGLAVIASPSAKKVLAEDLRQRQHKLAAIKKEAEEKAAKMEGVTLRIAAKTSKFGVIFGSVTSIQIAEELTKQGFDVDRRIIYLKSPIKEVGDYTCQVRLHKEVHVNIPFSVYSENYEEIEQKEETKAPEATEQKEEVKAPEATTTEEETAKDE